MPAPASSRLSARRPSLRCSRGASTVVTFSSAVAGAARLRGIAATLDNFPRIRNRGKSRRFHHCSLNNTNNDLPPSFSAQPRRRRAPRAASCASTYAPVSVVEISFVFFLEGTVIWPFGDRLRANSEIPTEVCSGLIVLSRYLVPVRGRGKTERAGRRGSRAPGTPAPLRAGEQCGTCARRLLERRSVASGSVLGEHG